MSSVSGIRIPGLSTGMDTETMIKQMLTADQNKIDKVQQKEQTLTWQQEIYRQVISDITALSDKYFSSTSKDSILSSSAWNTTTINSSNSSAVTATASAGANNIDYQFEVEKLAEPAKATSKTIASGDAKLSELGDFKAGTFKLELGKDKDGNIIYSEPIEITDDDTAKSLAKKINDASGGKINASYSEMTNSFTIETKETGSNSGFKIVDEKGGDSDALNFLGLEGNKDEAGNFIGEKSKIIVKDGSGNTKLKELETDSNSFTIDGITFDVHSTTKTGEGVRLTSKQDTQPVIDKMEAFVDEYNKIMDKIYNLVTQKTNRDYPPLTDAQREDMSEEEIERWETKAKEGLLRNDSDMRKFMDDMQNAIFGDNMLALNEMGLTSHENYSKKGQISLDVEKFKAALENDSSKVYEMFAKNDDSIIENIKNTVNKYASGSSSIFAKKAGIEKTASAVSNFYSDQLKRQAEIMKELKRKMANKEDDLYKKFGTLESTMNQLNSQMNYFTQV